MRTRSSLLTTGLSFVRYHRPLFRVVDLLDGAESSRAPALSVPGIVSIKGWLVFSVAVLCQCSRSGFSVGVVGIMGGVLGRCPNFHGNAALGPKTSRIIPSCQQEPLGLLVKLRTTTKALLQKQPHLPLQANADSVSRQV